MRDQVEPFVIGCLAGYELAAYATGLPTVTALMLRLPRRVRWLVVAGLWWWSVDHFQIRN